MSEVAPAQTIVICPVCHSNIKSTDYFCFNCGKNLHPAPPSTSISSQISLYLKSALLPPMGIIWGLKYLRQPEEKSKIVGLAAIGLTVVIIIFAVAATVSFVNTVNQSVSGLMEVNN